MRREFAVVAEPGLSTLVGLDTGALLGMERDNIIKVDMDFGTMVHGGRASMR